MDPVASPVDDDLDLDALMIRVREAATPGAARPEAAADTKGTDIDLIRVIEAQGEWNEQTRQSLVALVDCLRTLRDDWADAHARLREELGQLSALVSDRAKPKARRSSKRGRRRS